jgi:hypothetical protein
MRPTIVDFHSGLSLDLRREVTHLPVWFGLGVSAKVGGFSFFVAAV